MLKPSLLVEQTGFVTQIEPVADVGNGDEYQVAIIETIADEKAFFLLVHVEPDTLKVGEEVAFKLSVEYVNIIGTSGGVSGSVSVQGSPSNVPAA